MNIFRGSGVKEDLAMDLK
ncbi:hypothetical protein B4U80_02836, partial [Leptotrombidium deliense]